MDKDTMNTAAEDDVTNTSIKKKASICGSKRSMFDYFSPAQKSKRLNFSNEAETSSSSTDNFNSDANQARIVSTENITVVPVTQPAQETSSSSNVICNDIGKVLSSSVVVDDFTKRSLLENHWVPPKGYSFPFSKHTKCNREVRRFLNRSHLDKYSWLVLSDYQQGIYCKYCALFSVTKDGGFQNNVPLQKLVTKPLQQFAKLLGKDGDLEVHQNHRYHKACVEAGKTFLQTSNDISKNIANRLVVQRVKEIEDNRNRIKPIIKCIVFLGKQNIPLRGHRDDGILSFEDSGIVNEGNFRAILKFISEMGNNELQEHLQTCAKRAMYTSKTIQNELIECCASEILRTISEYVNRADFYSVIFDETTDIAGQSQLSIVLRYVCDGSIREDFVGFVDCFATLTEERLGDEDNVTADELALTGQAIGKIVLTQMRNLKLNMMKCVGIGTDGCSVMTSDIKGAVHEIKKNCENARKTPCFNHKLNLSLSKTAEIKAIRNAVGVMKEVINFFTSTPKRRIVLQKHMGKQLRKLCETRWVERHDGVLQFKENLPRIVSGLEEISSWKDFKTASAADSLVKALCTCDFIVAMVCLSEILACTLPLSRALQKIALDLPTASSLVANSIEVLKTRRENAERVFSINAYVEVKQICAALDVDIRLPRITTIQRNRANYPADNPEQYFLLSVYIPLLDNILMDLNERFSSDVLQFFGLSCVLPGRSTQTFFEDASMLFKSFGCLLPDNCTVTMLGAELQLWIKKISTLDSTNLNVLDLLKICDKDIFPNICTLLLLLVTLPISNATSERSFSALKRLKTWLRSRMTESRLNGLALLHVHRDINIDVERVLDNFASLNNRRLSFIL